MIWTSSREYSCLIFPGLARLQKAQPEAEWGSTQYASAYRQVTKLVVNNTHHGEESCVVLLSCAASMISSRGMGEAGQLASSFTQSARHVLTISSTISISERGKYIVRLAHTFHGELMLSLTSGSRTDLIRTRQWPYAHPIVLRHFLVFRTDHHTSMVGLVSIMLVLFDDVVAWIHLSTTYLLVRDASMGF